jgi:multiple sugar transport system permease protein
MSSIASNTVKRKRKKLGQDNLAGILFALPGFVLLVLFVLVPFIAAFVLSFYNVHAASDNPPIWMGLEQYRRILSDPDTSPIFWKSLGNNFYFALMVVPLQTGLAVLLALMLNQKLKGIAFFRSFFFMPVVFPMSLVAVIWTLFYSRDNNGIFNSALQSIFGNHFAGIDWLGDPKLAMISIAIMSIWAGVGFQMVIILAGLQEIPLELYEAAKIDKAGAWHSFWNVTFPGLRNTLVFVVIVTTIFSLRLFDQVFILTNGGPLDSTSTVMFQSVTSALTDDNVGKGAAMTVIFVLIIIVLTVIQRLLLRQEKEIK